jgi:hypothetical protein
LILSTSIYFYRASKSSIINVENIPCSEIVSNIIKDLKTSKSVEETIISKLNNKEKSQKTPQTEVLNEPCSDPLWCNIEMPLKSHFKFDPPTDINKWKVAQLQASRGEQVILSRVMKVFPNHYDFLDGDISFRKLHFAIDFFVDERRDLSPLLSNSNPQRKLKVVSQYNNSNLTSRRILSDEKNEKTEKTKPIITAAKLVNGKLAYPWELEGKKVIPEPYDFRGADRAPVVQIGYTAYGRDSGF